MRLPSRKILGVLVIQTMLVVVAATPALAADPAANRGGVVISTNADGSAVTTAWSERTKTEATSNGPASAASGRSFGGVTIQGCGWPNCRPAQLSGTRLKSIRPPGGSTANIKVSFSSSVAYPIPETSATFSGASHAYWLGANPLYPNEITLTDRFHVDGLGLSASFPVGAGVSASGGDGSYTNTVKGNYWRIDHYYSNFRFNGIPIWAASQTVSTTFKFGSSHFSTETYDHALI